MLSSGRDCLSGSHMCGLASGKGPHHLELVSSLQILRHWTLGMGSSSYRCSQEQAFPPLVTPACQQLKHTRQISLNSLVTVSFLSVKDREGCGQRRSHQMNHQGGYYCGCFNYFYVEMSKFDTLALCISLETLG